MEYATLGNTGLLVSKLCFGTMTFGDGEPTVGSQLIAGIVSARRASCIDPGNLSPLGGRKHPQPIGNSKLAARIASRSLAVSPPLFAMKSPLDATSLSIYIYMTDQSVRYLLTRMEG